MSKLMRKNVFLDPDVLKRAQQILGTRTESEAIREALQLVTLRDEAIRGFDQVAGKSPDFRDLWENV
jgi:Arc/MetJ family transcription regulator